MAIAAAGMMYGSAALAAGSTTAGPFATGKILFTGKINDAPCDVSTLDSQITVGFGSISQKHFKAKGDVTDSQPFTIHLKNCSFDAATSAGAIPLSKVTIAFNSEAGVVDKTNHDWDSIGSANNVGVQLLQSDNHTIIEPDTASVDIATPLNTGDNSLNFFARLVSTDASVTPGDINVALAYTLTYK